MTWLRGRSLRWKWLLCHAPHSHRSTTTMISPVRMDGTTACMTLGGVKNTKVFRTYVREVLIPSMRAAKLSSWTTSALIKTSEPSP